MINYQKGVLLIDKPSGLSSNFVVTKVKKLTGAKRVGHTGTLDPFATGMLIVLLGSYTRLAEYFLGFDKVYHVVIELGKTSNTYDVDGEILSIKPTYNIKFDLVQKIIKEFIGEIEQIPPIYSAIKIRGKRAYEMARKGKNVEISPRKITIYKIDILNFNNPYIEIRVHCSSGTYIRSLVNDIGKKLGCGAIVKSLRREKIKNFDILDALTLPELQNIIQKKKLKSFFINPLVAFENYAKILISDEKDFLLVKNGNTLKKESNIPPGDAVLIDDRNNLLAIAKVESKNGFSYIKPMKVLI